MPYIEKARREEIREHLAYVISDLKQHEWSAGEVNYTIFMLLYEWWKDKRSYKGAALIEGTLSCIASEFYRRVIAPYENMKIIENGDVIEAEEYER